MGRFKIKISNADKLFSLLVRSKARWQCQRCWKPFEDRRRSLHCSHFWGRGTKATRWDTDNACALCVTCHEFFTANPSEHREFFLTRLGKERFESLMFRAKNVGRAPDEKLIEIGLKLELQKRGIQIGKKGLALT